MDIKVDYTEANNNNMRANAERAIQVFLSGKTGTCLTIFPQALNPLLKALEGLGLWRQVLVIPYSDSNNKPVYIVMKTGSRVSVDMVSISSQDEVK